MTALGMINFDAAKKIDSNKNAAILTTDLSTAFDSIYHEIVVEKLSYYGVTESSCCCSYKSQKYSTDTGCKL